MMKIYKVYINLFNWESNIEFNTKYFIDKKLALNYKDKLENWRVRFVKILKNISDCFNYKEENCSKKEYEDYLSSHQKMFDLLYKDSNYDLVHYNSEVFIKELNISESTNIEI